VTGDAKCKYFFAANAKLMVEGNSKRDSVSLASIAASTHRAKKVHGISIDHLPYGSTAIVWIDKTNSMRITHELKNE
jgi:hypothetical protein